MAGKLTLHGVISQQSKNEWKNKNGLIENVVPSPDTSLLRLSNMNSLDFILMKISEDILKLINDTIKHFQWRHKVGCAEKMDIELFLSLSAGETSCREEKTVVLIPLF
jgi:hypothetical protein